MAHHIQSHHIESTTHVAVTALNTHATPIPNIAPINDPLLPSFIKCFGCTDKAYPYFVNQVWTHECACDECNKDLFPHYVTYHCRHPSHTTDDENAEQFYDICLNCVFQKLNKPIPSKAIDINYVIYFGRFFDPLPPCNKM